MLNSSVRIWDTSLQIAGKSAAFAAIWLKLRCTGELSIYVLSRDMTDPAPLICQSNLARRQSGQSCVHVSEYETCLAYLWQSRNDCCHMIKVQVHRNKLGTYHRNRHSIIATRIPQSKQSTRLISFCFRIWNVDSWICGRAIACAGISYSFGDTSDPHPNASEIETRLGYSLLCSSIRCWVCIGPWLQSDITDISNPVQN